MGYEKDLKRVVRDLKNQDADIRKQAVDWIQEMVAYTGKVQVDSAVIQMLAREAAETFPASRGEWDDPSFHLVQLAVLFPGSGVEKSLCEFYDGYSPEAKCLVLAHLAETLEEENWKRLMDLIEQDIQRKRLHLPIPVLISIPQLATEVIETHLHQLEEPTCRKELYPLLLFCLNNQYLHRFQPTYLTPLIQQHYREARDVYLKYDQDYQMRHVYGPWKETYLDVRAHLLEMLNLLEYYYTDTSETFLKEALGFRDPVVRTGAIIASLQRNLPVEASLIEESATHIETSLMTWWELVRIHQEHRHPIPLEKRQPYFAKTYAFDQVWTESDFYLEEIYIKASVEPTEWFETKVRYYLAKAVINGEAKPMWIGGFPLEDEDGAEYTDASVIWDEPYQDGEEEPYQKRLLEEWDAKQKEWAEHVYYENTNLFGETFRIQAGNVTLTTKKSTQTVRILDIRTVQQKKTFLKTTLQIETKEKTVLQVPTSLIDYRVLEMILTHITGNLKEQPVFM